MKTGFLNNLPDQKNNNTQHNQCVSKKINSEVVNFYFQDLGFEIEKLVMQSAYSKILNLNFEINLKSGEAKFSDGVIYSAGEIQKLKKLNQEEVVTVHKLKNSTQGEIMEIKEKCL